MSVAQGYATGLGATYKPVNNTKYGFIYEFKISDDQRYYHDYGIESAAIQSSSLLDQYETPIFENKNPLKNIYLVVGDRVTKITDDNGKYISKEWEDFTQLHETHLRMGTEFEKKRTDNQIKALDKNEISTYQKTTASDTLDLHELSRSEFENIDVSDKKILMPETTVFRGLVKLNNIDFNATKNLEINNADISTIKHLKLPETVKITGNIITKLPEDIDGREVKNLEVNGADISTIKNLKPTGDVKISNSSTKLPEDIDCSKAKNLELDDVDISAVKNLKFPETVKISGLSTEFGKNTDLSTIKNLEFDSIDLSKTENIIFPDNVKLNGYFDGENIDLRAIKSLEFGNVDLSNIESIKFPTNVKFGHYTKLGGNIDFSNIQNLELHNMNLSKVESIKFPANVKLGEGVVLGKNKDFGSVEHLEINNANLSNIDLSHVKNLKLSGQIRVFGDVELPKNINTENLEYISDNNKVYYGESYKKCKETEKLLTSWGIDKDSYMILTREDNAYTTYNNGAKSISSYFDSGAKEIANTNSKVVYGRNNGIVAAYFDNDTYVISKDDKLKDKLYYKGQDVNLGVMMSNGERFCNPYGIRDTRKNSEWKNIEQKAEENNAKLLSQRQEAEAKLQEAEIKTQESEAKPQETEVKAQEADAKTAELKETLKQQKAETKAVQNEAANNTKTQTAPTAVNENTSDLHNTLKEQKEAALQTKNAQAQTPAANGDLHNTLKAQKENSSIGSKVSAVSNSIDNTLEKAGKVLNDNAAGRTINKIDSWRPKNKVGAKVVGAAGVVPTAAIAATGVTAYEQYKSGDTKGAAATMAKGTVHATIQGAATAGGMNLAAKGLSKGTEKIVTKVAEHNLAKKAAQKTAVKTAEKAATKAAVKAGAKAAGKAAGKAVLKKIPLVSLGAGLYFAYERAKKGEWGKAAGEVCSGAAGCVPGVGTLVSTGIDCGLAVADTKQAVDETKKQQAQQQQKQTQKSPEQIKQEQKKKAEMAKRAKELRSTKPGQSQNKPAPAKKQQQKPVEKGVWDKFTDLFSR